MNAISTFTFLHESKQAGQASYCQDSIYIANPTFYIIVVGSEAFYLYFYCYFIPIFVQIWLLNCIESLISERAMGWTVRQTSVATLTKKSRHPVKKMTKARLISYQFLPAGTNRPSISTTALCACRMQETF